MTDLPMQREGSTAANAPYHIVPDNVKGGWNLYDTSQPQHPQQHFASKEEAIAWAEAQSGKVGTGFTVEEFEAPHVGRQASET